jgi:hypothetical protein
MSAKDVYHETVRIALEKEGWHITHEPYEIIIFDPGNNEVVEWID